MSYFTPSPIERRPVPAADIPFLNRCYLHTSCADTDASMIWGTEVDMTDLQKLLKVRNRRSQTLLTAMSVLVRAVGLALARHPHFNCRLFGKKIHRFNEANVLIPVQRRHHGPTLCLLRQVDQKSYEELARTLWAEQRQISRGEQNFDVAEWLFSAVPAPIADVLLRSLLWVANHVHKPMDRFDEMLRGAPVIVNHFGFPGAPPLLAYKPSRFASLCSLMNITLGPICQRPGVRDGEVIALPMAGLFVRGDHRVVDARELAQFAGFLADVLTHPFDFDLVPHDSEVDGQVRDARIPQGACVR